MRTTSTLLAACAVLLAVPALAQSGAPTNAPAPTSAPTVVLVHGAWANGSSWAKVIPLLQARASG